MQLLQKHPAKRAGVAGIALRAEGVNMCEQPSPAALRQVQCQML